jgi:hypothetical protein
MEVVRLQGARGQVTQSTVLPTASHLVGSFSFWLGMSLLTAFASPKSLSLV